MPSPAHRSPDCRCRKRPPIRPAGLPPQAGVIGLFAGLVCYGLIAAAATRSSVVVGCVLPRQRSLAADDLRSASRVDPRCRHRCRFCRRRTAPGAMSNPIARPVLRGFASTGADHRLAMPHLVGMQARRRILRAARRGNPARRSCLGMPRWVADGRAAGPVRLREDPLRPGSLACDLGSIAASPWLAAHGCHRSDRPSPPQRTFRAPRGWVADPG